MRPPDTDLPVAAGTEAAKEHTAAELTASQVGYFRAGRAVLTDVTLTAYAGSAVAVTGPSGSGKSSLLALLAGLERPTNGEVRLAGVPLRPGDAAQRQRYGLILQGYGLVSVLTAAENVELVLQARGVPAAEVVARALAALDRVGMGEAADHLVEELSGGQQQRVAVARALVVDPEVILADEPTAELDAGNRQLILGLLLDQARMGRIVVLASHDREVADACDRELRLIDGRLQAEVAMSAYPEPEFFSSGYDDLDLDLAPEPAPARAADREPAADPELTLSTPRSTPRSAWRAHERPEEAEPAGVDPGAAPSSSGWERPRG